MKPDMLSIVEAAHAETRSNDAWRTALIDALGVLDEGLGVVVATVRRDDAGRASADPFYGTASAALMARFEGMLPQLPPEHLAVYFDGHSSGQTGSSLFAAPDFAPYSAMMRPLGAEDCLGVFGLVDLNTSFGFNVPLPRRRTEPGWRRRRLFRLGVHLGAALRARTRACEPEAWFEPGGKLLEARGEAIAYGAVLRDRVRAVDRARTASGRADVEAALDAWTALVEGRWSLVDRFDSDGRRFVVAKPNHPKLGRRLALTRREEQVAKLHALGHSSKEVAYTLGISPPTVSAHLDAALRKLGLATKADLMRLHDTIVGSGEGEA